MTTRTKLPVLMHLLSKVGRAKNYDPHSAAGELPRQTPVTKLPRPVSAQKFRLLPLQRWRRRVGAAQPPQARRQKDEEDEAVVIVVVLVVVAHTRPGRLSSSLPVPFFV